MEYRPPLAAGGTPRRSSEFSVPLPGEVRLVVSETEGGLVFQNLQIPILRFRNPGPTRIGTAGATQTSQPDRRTHVYEGVKPVGPPEPISGGSGLVEAGQRTGPSSATTETVRVSSVLRDV